METRIQAVHFDASEHLVEFIEKKVSKLDQYFDGILTAEVTLKVVKPETVNNKEVNIKVSVPHSELLFSEKICDSFEEAVDICVDAISKQLRKLKEKTR
ncbi:MAG: ribosome-associated translation inhibitor RaiA [Bacteroidales bacterium]|jgi:putative sigma-54 modulation protein